MVKKRSVYRGRRQRRFPWFVAFIAVGYAALVCVGMAPLPFLPAFGASNGGGLAKTQNGESSPPRYQTTQRYFPVVFL